MQKGNQMASQGPPGAGASGACGQPSASAASGKKHRAKTATARPAEATASASATATAPEPASSTTTTESRKKKRKAADADLRHELDELREWKRRAEEKQKHMNSMLSASSSCIVCLDVRPDLISYGACGHMVCVPCAMDHVSRKLMVMRRATHNTGCKARLAYFALNVEDSEFSCPMCRQGQLDLMGAGLALLPNFAYHELVRFCAARHSQRPKPPSPSSTAPALVPPAPATATTAAPHATSSSVIARPSAGVEAGLSKELSSTRRAYAAQQIERNKAAALKALQALAEQERAERAERGEEPKGDHQIRCQFCGLRSSPLEDLAAGKGLTPSEVIRHIWRCPKRTFICGFTDCRKPFTWECVFKDRAPSVVGVGARNESQWLNLVNLAFAVHMRRECDHLTTCCIRWCDMQKTPARIPLRDFAEHERRHQHIDERFKAISSIAESTLRVERTLSGVLRHEFNRLPALLPSPHATMSTSTHISGKEKAPSSSANVVAASDAKTVAPSAMSSATAVVSGGDVTTFANPIAREIHNSLDALNDLLRSYMPASGKDSDDDDADAGLCPLHISVSSSEGRPDRHRIRQRPLRSAARSHRRNSDDLATGVDDPDHDTTAAIMEMDMELDLDSNDDDDDDEEYLPDHADSAQSSDSDGL